MTNYDSDLELYMQKCIYFTNDFTTIVVNGLRAQMHPIINPELTSFAAFAGSLYQQTLENIAWVQEQSKFLDYELSQGMKDIFKGRIKEAWNAYINFYKIDYLPKFDGYG